MLPHKKHINCMRVCGVDMELVRINSASRYSSLMATQYFYYHIVSFVCVCCFLFLFYESLDAKFPATREMGKYHAKLKTMWTCECPGNRCEDNFRCFMVSIKMFEALSMRCIHVILQYIVRCVGAVKRRTKMNTFKYVVIYDQFDMCHCGTHIRQILHLCGWTILLKTNFMSH